jgi:hypothetical protein
MPEPVKWQHQYLNIIPASGDELKKELNRLGQFGWEQCGILLHEMFPSKFATEKVLSFFVCVKRIASDGPTGMPDPVAAEEAPAAAAGMPAETKGGWELGQ